MKLPVALSSILLASISIGSALTLEINYQYDNVANGGSGFFASNPLAREAVEQAAADLSAAITSHLGAVTTDTFTGTNGSTTVTFNWALTFENPSRPGETIKLDTFSFAQDRVTMYVGMRPLTGSTLGQGGSGGSSLNYGYTRPSSDSLYQAQAPGAVDQAEAASNVMMTRGDGPVIGSISGSLGVTNTNFQLSRGAMLGTLWFDNDTNNDGLIDSAEMLSSFWHYDPDTNVASMKNDLYSVALHEMLHSLGMGVSESWKALVSGTSWLGGEVIELTGGNGSNLIASGGGHIREGLSSFRLDGVAQEAVMDPSLTVGRRKYLTEMDLAFLRDIGYSTIPEPSTGLMLACGVWLLGMRRRRG